MLRLSKYAVNICSFSSSLCLAFGLTTPLRPQLLQIYGCFPKALDTANHPAFLFVDGVSSIGSIEFRMDDWGVDAIDGSGLNL